jgi:hypothetical protein
MHIVRAAKAEAGAGAGKAEEQKDRQQDYATECDVSAGEPGSGSAGLIRRGSGGAQWCAAIGAKSRVIRVRQSAVRAGDHDVYCIGSQTGSQRALRLLADAKRREDPIQDVIGGGGARYGIDRLQRGVEIE